MAIPRFLAQVAGSHRIFALRTVACNFGGAIMSVRVNVAHCAAGDRPHRSTRTDHRFGDLGERSLRRFRMLEATMSQWEEADEHFGSALHTYTRLAATSLLAYTQLEYAAAAEAAQGSEGLASAIERFRELAAGRPIDQLEDVVSGRKRYRRWLYSESLKNSSQDTSKSPSRCLLATRRPSTSGRQPDRPSPLNSPRESHERIPPRSVRT